MHYPDFSHFSAKYQAALEKPAAVEMDYLTYGGDGTKSWKKSRNPLSDGTGTLQSNQINATLLPSNSQKYYVVNTNDLNV